MGDEDEPPPAPPAGVELAKLDYTLKDMNGVDVRLADFKAGR